MVAFVVVLVIATGANTTATVTATATATADDDDAVFLIEIELDRGVFVFAFSITSPYTAVNRRLDRERYPELIFGFCLLRIIHFIIALRLLYPETPILISKYDFLDAYCRMSVPPEI